MKDMPLQQLLGKLKALEPKVFFALLGLAVVVVIALDVLLIARPQVATIMALDAQMAQVKTDIDALLVNKQRMASFRGNLDRAREGMKSFKAMVHKEDGIPAVLKTISTMANHYGVKIDQLVPQKSDGVALVKNEDGTYSSLAVLVRARTGYHDLGRFLNRLEQERVFWQLETINITADESDPERQVVKMQLKVLILGN